MKTGKILGRILLVALAAFVVLLIGMYLGVTIRYVDFFAKSDSAFWTPGIYSGFVPQGFHDLKEHNAYLISGYMEDHTASRIYIRKQNGETYFTELVREDGTAYDAHAGGVTVNDNYVYLPGEVGVDVFLLADILDGDTAAMIGKIQGTYDTDCCTFYNGYLFVGDFYYPGTYETPEAHRVTTPAGDKNKAIIAVYRADAAAEFGIAPQPVAAISIREKVQGIGFTENGQIVLSTSYGLSSSNLWYYAPDESRQGSMELMGQTVPLFYLDRDNLVHSVEMPPMSEEVICKEGKVYVLFESACNKYYFGRWMRGNHVYAYEQ